ncbi:MAG TPA: DUF6036 family nucleotidyltransferase [Solirubrobacterales bacterium]|jgi:hypothetical protein|nr:DUF6036 family nucleotidyltransferase [Solirubrobacterales bacterium]
MSDIENWDAVDRLLSALGEQLAATDARFELVVIGGSGLLALGMIERSTRDVDLVALRSGDELESPKPLPPALEAARDRVARDFALSAGWLNAGPTDLLDLGLPEGFIDRLDRRDFGEGLIVYFASRLDQIYFKLYAMVDAGGPGKHERDLRALAPTERELLEAARWSRTHDPSEGYEEMLAEALAYLGVENADLRA